MRLTIQYWWLGACISVALLAWIYLRVYCVSQNCSVAMFNNFVEPLFWLSIILVIISTMLLAFPDYIFKYWLLYLASWTVPLIWLLAKQANMSGITGVLYEPGQLVWWYGIVLYVITSTIIIGYYFLRYVKTKTTPSSWWNLLIIPLIAVIITVVPLLF